VRRAIDARLAIGKYASPDDVPGDTFRSIEHEDEVLSAFQQAIDDWQQDGEGRPLEHALMRYAGSGTRPKVPW
jgi:hypothetical protein